MILEDISKKISNLAGVFGIQNIGSKINRIQDIWGEMLDIRDIKTI